MVRETKIRQASWISIIGNALLSVIKIITGLVSGSLAVLADGIDSATDIAGSVVTLIAARIMSKPPDIRFPYGYAKADIIATKVLSFIIFFAGAQLAISAVQGLAGGEVRKLPTLLAIYVTLISVAGKIILAIYQLHMGKKYYSPMLLANGRNMQNDVLTSVSVLLGLVFTHVFNLPVIDPLIALLVSLWIMYTAFKIFMEGNAELMDGVDDPHTYKQIFEAVKKVEGAFNPHRVRVRKIGSSYLVGIDIEVKGEITVNQAHTIAHEVEKNIKDMLNEVYDIIVHIEPVGVDHEKEKFGVAENDLK